MRPWIATPKRARDDAARLRAMNTLYGIVLGFLLGSIPCGLLLTRRAGLGDIRTIGSGNIGATNVLRTGRRDLAALTLVLDVVKGTAAVVLARRIGGDGALAGIAAVLGHTLTPWLRFRGGKGVATGLGALLGMFWPLGCIVGATWILALAVSRISSVAALSACTVAAIGAIAWPAPSPTPVLAVAAWIAWRHRANIGRLRAGTEPRVGR